MCRSIDAGTGRSLHGQVGSAAAAQDEHVDLILKVHQAVHMIDRHIRAQGMQGFGRPAGKKGLQLHIGVCAQGQLHPASQIAVAHNANSDFVHCPSLLCLQRICAVYAPIIYQARSG